MNREFTMNLDGEPEDPAAPHFLSKLEAKAVLEICECRKDLKDIFQRSSLLQNFLQ